MERFFLSSGNVTSDKNDSHNVTRQTRSNQCCTSIDSPEKDRAEGFIEINFTPTKIGPWLLFVRNILYESKAVRLDASVITSYQENELRKKFKT